MTSWIERELFPAKEKEGAHFTAELGEYPNPNPNPNPNPIPNPNPKP